MERLATKPLPRSELWRYVLPLIALITVKMSRLHSPRFFPWHERWRAVKAKQLLAALLRMGWTVAWQSGSHVRLKRAGWDNYTFAFHGGDEVGPGLLAQIAKKTGLPPEDL